MVGRAWVKLRERTTEGARRMLNALVGRYAPDRDVRFFATEHAWIRELEAGAAVIRAELDELLKKRDLLPSFQEISQSQRHITNDDRWKTFFLYAHGRPVEENCRRCPGTSRLVKAAPGMKTAMFSILAPGKHIPAHEGAYRGVLRYHLALIVPRPEAACRIMVGGQPGHWTEGRSLLFDDTFTHEVWNDSDETRVVLFMDVVRPLPLALSWINRLTIFLLGHSLFTEDVVANAREWSRRLRADAAHGNDT